MSMEAYKILNLSFDASPEDARNAFKRMALIHHPDKGGDPRIFNMVKEAYKAIIHRLTQAQRQDFGSMRDAHKNYQEEEQVIRIDPNNFNREQFNRVFEEHRIVKDSDKGYGDWNEEVEEPHARDFDSRVTIYEEPEQILTSLGYETLGQGKVKDYSSGIYSQTEYTDYKKAYAIPLKEHEISRNRDYKSGSIEDIKRSRGRNLAPSQDEINEFKRLQQIKLKREQDRQRRQQEQMEHGLRIGGAMYNRIGYQSSEPSVSAHPKYFKYSK
jgi:hypothetical protein